MPAVLGSPPPKQQEKRQRRKSALVPSSMPATNESIECDITGIIASGETFSKHTSTSQSEELSSEEAVNKKMCCLLQQVQDNGNEDDISAIRESMMKFLTGTATARKDRFTEVLQELMKNINKSTEKEKVLHDMGRYLCEHAADSDGLIDIGSKLLVSVPKSRNTTNSNNPNIWAKKTSKAVRKLISVILE